MLAGMDLIYVDMEMSQAKAEEKKSLWFNHHSQTTPADLTPHAALQCFVTGLNFPMSL